MGLTCDQCSTYCSTWFRFRCSLSTWGVCLCSLFRHKAGERVHHDGVPREARGPRARTLLLLAHERRALSRYCTVFTVRYSSRFAFRVHRSLASLSLDALMFMFMFMFRRARSGHAVLHVAWAHPRTGLQLQVRYLVARLPPLRGTYYTFTSLFLFQLIRVTVFQFVFVSRSSNNASL